MMPLSDLNGIGGAVPGVTDAVSSDTYDPFIENALAMQKELSYKLADTVSAIQGAMQDTNTKHNLLSGYTVDFPNKSAKIIPFPSAVYWDEDKAYYSYSKTNWKYISREELQDDVRKVVKNATREKRTVSKNTLAHYNPSSYGKDKPLSAKKPHAEVEDSLVESIVSFTLGTLRELENKHTEQMTAMENHYNSRDAHARQRITDLQMKVAQLNTKLHMATVDLAVVREREARLSVIDSTDGRKFRDEE